MAQCDICGSSALLFKAVVEGVLLSVCGKCSGFGNVVEVGSQPVTKRRVDIALPVVEEEIVADYAEKIKNARERENITQEFLAKALSEKENLLQKVEAGHVEPSIALARKIENFFKIRLVEKIELRSERKTLDIKDNSMTIGDLIKLSKK